MKWLLLLRHKLSSDPFTTDRFNQISPELLPL